jgi:hypothetical protein
LPVAAFAIPAVLYLAYRVVADFRLQKPVGEQATETSSAELSLLL